MAGLGGCRVRVFGKVPLTQVQAVKSLILNASLSMEALVTNVSKINILPSAPV